ncbi:uncharacterized protein LOC120678520 isoform X2 [Panicum virgatum]|uniref:Uncharacterized protein n=1 Tax=Panicum virgatum TaxID=38727 RepID=A0A8T0R1J5_PANVG|nr:uncharacterized protein LOC120678520 isoform X2 [Panicum virgatum]KAG2579462.1 hypothetical protein PVAP13_6NG288875 [Panicum virgatum]
MLLPPHPCPLAPLRASSSSLGARLRPCLPFPSSPSHAPLLSRSPLPRWPPPLRAHAPGEPVRRRGAFGLDAFLSAAELLCLAPPAICSLVCAARLVFSPSSAGAGPLPLADGRLLVLQYLLLVGAVAIGSLIRRRQSGRLRPASGAAERVGVGLVERMEKVEDSVRGMVAAVGVLSRTVEKLSVRFRVLRRTLRDPISETTNLAQKNSEATRILAAQEGLLEKEIGAIQKVLYAMQEQQQKQLDLILAIGEASTILGGEQDMLDGGSARSSSTDPAAEIENKQAKVSSGAVTGHNKP